METPESIPQQSPTREDLQIALRAELVKQQDVLYGIVGGLSAALLGAVLWAVITVATKYQIGYMAIGVGLLVGFGVRFFGAGIDKYFGVIGAVFALVGCLLGNLLSQVGFAAHQEGLGYFEVMAALNWEIISELFTETFNPMDILFYAIAAYEGFRFGFRNIDEELEKAVAAGTVEPAPYAKYRMHIAIGLFATLSIVGFFVSTAGSGVRQYKYESGMLQSTGELNAAKKETGAWEYWWENGQKQATGNYEDGKPVGEWVYYNDDGTMSGKGLMLGGMKHGVWTEYYPGGTLVASVGEYAYGRQTGPWEVKYSNGNAMSKGNYLLDLPDGDWEYFYENGNPSSKGKYDRGAKTGLWTGWFENGKKSSEFEYAGNEQFKMQNTWDENGKGIIVNGNGTYTTYYYNGKVLDAGPIKNGEHLGIWNTFFANGIKKEVGEFKDNMYYVTNAWDSTGKPTVVQGNGTTDYYYPDGSRFEEGKVMNGLRVGSWNTFFQGGGETLAAQTIYKEGKIDGIRRSYDMSGFLNAEGNYVNDSQDGPWKWYSAEGVLESEATFVNGKKEGEQKFYNGYGDMTKIEVYKEGKLTATNAVASSK